MRYCRGLGLGAFRAQEVDGSEFMDRLEKSKGSDTSASTLTGNSEKPLCPKSSP